MIFGFENLSKVKRNVNWKVCACDTFLITTVANQRYLIFPKKPDPSFDFFAKNLPLKKKSTKKNVCQKRVEPNRRLQTKCMIVSL